MIEGNRPVKAILGVRAARAHARPTLIQRPGGVAPKSARYAQRVLRHGVESSVRAGGESDDRPGAEKYPGATQGVPAFGRRRLLEQNANPPRMNPAPAAVSGTIELHFQRAAPLSLVSDGGLIA